jgi:hypothetical protein
LNDSGSGALFFIFVFVAIVLVSFYARWHYRRADQILQNWAARNRVRILSSETRHLRRGPFWWSTSDSQVVLYVHVRDESGRERKGYLRLGSFMGGMLTDQVDVGWDDE